MGDPPGADCLPGVPSRLQHVGHGSRRPGTTCPLPQPPRGRRRLAVRTRARFSHPHVAAADRLTEPLRRGAEGLEPIGARTAGARRLRAAAPLGRDTGSDRAVRRRDRRAGLRARDAAPPWRRRALCRPAGVHVGRPRRLPAATRGDRRGRSSSWSSATTRSSTAHRSSISGSAGAAQRRGRDHDRRRGQRADGDRGGRGADDAAAASKRARAAAAPGGASSARLVRHRGRRRRSSRRGGARARLRGQARVRGAFHLPTTPNGRGVALAWACAADEDEVEPERMGLLTRRATMRPPPRACAPWPSTQTRRSRSPCFTAGDQKG